MSGDRQRQVLADLDIPLWLPRQPLAGGPHQSASSSPVALSGEPESVNLPALSGEPEPLNPPDAMPHSEPSNHPGASRHPSLSKEGNGVENANVENADFAPVAPNRRAAAIAQMDWDTLVAEVRQCTACGLCKTRTQTVFGVGNRRAEWLVIGEAPGADEDQQGEPFVGRAGKLLNPMLQAVGLKREQVFIANILKCRPPDNRDPAPAEAASCRPFLERQIALLRPRIILAVGRIAAHNLLATDTPIGKLRGLVHRFGPARLPLVVVYHPAYLLRSPREKRKAWDDLRLARRALTTHPPAPGWRSPEP
jgi:DNA polymerase